MSFNLMCMPNFVEDETQHRQHMFPVLRKMWSSYIWIHTSVCNCQQLKCQQSVTERERGVINDPRFDSFLVREGIQITMANFLWVCVCVCVPWSQIGAIYTTSSVSNLYLIDLHHRKNHWGLIVLCGIYWQIDYINHESPLEWLLFPCRWVLYTLYLLTQVIDELSIFLLLLSTQLHLARNRQTLNRKEKRRKHKLFSPMHNSQRIEGITQSLTQMCNSSRLVTIFRVVLWVQQSRFILVIIANAIINIVEKSKWFNVRYCVHDWIHCPLRQTSRISMW